MGLKLLDLEEYLSRPDVGVPLETRINTLTSVGLQSYEFVRLGLMLIEKAGKAEKERCKEKISNLDRMIKARQARLKIAI